MQVMAYILHHLKLELALPAGQFRPRYLAVLSHLPDHELLVEPLLSRQHEQARAFGREEAGAEAGIPL
jgi:hypothetical protein